MAVWILVTSFLTSPETFHLEEQLKKDDTQSLVEYVVDSIRDGIREGRYVPGQRLVESDLTKKFGISRGPLREAMSRLAGDDLVVIEPHRGVTVRKMTAQDLQELYDVRQSVESLAARLAATNIDDGDNRQRLTSMLKQMQACSKNSDVMAYAQLNDEFHKLIVDISGNRYLKKLISYLRVPIFRYQFHRFLDIKAKQASIAEHEAIGKAILEGDGNRAERAMCKHVKQSEKFIHNMSDES